MLVKILNILATLTAIIFNSFLAFLIIYKSPNNIGFYRYMMICVAFAEIVYSLFEYFTDITIYSFGHAYIVCRFVDDSFFSRSQNFAITLIYCAFYAFFISMFGSNFIFRYLAVSGTYNKKIVESRWCWLLFIVPIFYSCCWILVCQFLLHSSSESDQYLKDAVNLTFQKNIKNFTYIVVWYYSEEEGGKLDPIIKTFLGMICLWFMIISSLSCAIFFGSKCFFIVFKALQNTSTTSTFGRNIQQQLFKALVIQALIPILLMYLPCAVIFTLPMVYKQNFMATYLTTAFMIFPSIDPLPNFFIIGSFWISTKGFLSTLMICTEYLRNILDYISCKKSQSTTSMVTTMVVLRNNFSNTI